MKGEAIVGMLIDPVMAVTALTVRIDVHSNDTQVGHVVQELMPHMAASCQTGEV